ncbi:S-layer homology domain-containing protein [Paenibacillus sp. BAC0078]
MIRNFKRKMALLSIIALCITSIMPYGFAVTKVAALGSAQEVSSFPTDSRIGSMTVDEQRGYLYATMPETNELLFINKNTMQLVKKIFVGSQPNVMELVDNKLYIALRGATYIAVVDLDSKMLVHSIAIKDQPDQIAIDRNDLYYSNYDHANIHHVDLASETDTIIDTEIGYALLDTDPQSHQLFVGSDHGARLTAYTSTYGEKLWSTFSVDKFASSLLVNDSDIYYGTLRIDTRDRRIISTAVEDILAVDQDYVYSNSRIFTKAEGTAVASYGDGNSLLVEVDNAHNLYSTDIWGTAIHKYALDLPTTPPKAIEYSNGKDRITFNNRLKALAMGKNEKYLYAISEYPNRLLQIDTESFKVVADRYIGSLPTDIDIRNGVIYVSLSGSSHIAMIDTQNETDFMAPIKELEVGDITTDVAAGVGKVYYTDSGFPAHVGVFDSVYTNLLERYQQPTLTLNQDASMLYIGGGSLSQMNTATGEISLDQTKYGDGGNKEITVDSGYIYYGAHRYAENDLKNLYGEYKENNFYAHLLTAKDNLVLSTNAFYDRDTFKELFKLPFTSSFGYIKNDGQILLLDSGNSSTDTLQYTLYRFDSYDTMKSGIKNELRPISASFIDEDFTPQRISGELIMTPGDSTLDVRGYQISYYDADNKTVDGIYDDSFYSFEKQSDGTYIHQLNKSISASVKKIAIIPMVYKNFEGLVPQIDSQLIIRLWDYGTYYAENPVLVDTDSSLASIGGKVSFEAAKGEVSGDQYAVFFADQDGVIGGPIGIVEASGQTKYELPIPMGTVIPDGAFTISVRLLDQDGSMAPGYSLAAIGDRMTIAPDPDQITVVNAPGAADSVTVTGLKPGDKVKVYSYFGELYGEKVVDANSTKVVFKELNLNEIINVVLVSVTSVGKHESFYVLKEYPWKVDTNGGNSGGSSGGGSSGGGSSGGSGGVSPGGGGGGALPSVVAPVAGINTGKLTVTEVSKNTDGTSLAAVKLDDKVLDTELAKWSGSANKIVLSLTEVADVSKVTLSGNQILKITGKDKDAVIQIQGANNGFVVPADVLGLSATEAEKTNIVLTISSLKAEVAETANKLLTAQKIVQVGQPYQFSITKEITGGASVEITNADRFIGHIITLNKPAQSIDSLSAVMLNPYLGEIITVPAVITEDGDKITATIYRKGNSVYSLIAGKGGFTDVPSANFAKAAIDKLAVRMVVKGYDDGSFKPDNLVTRAEAATLLVKTLGIVPSSAQTSFKDVKPGAWYAGSVSTAVQAGLFKGYTDGSFKPEQTITQQEMVAIIYQALLYGGYVHNDTGNLQQFAASAGYKVWSSNAVDAMLKEGLLKSEDAFAIQANKQTTRAESAELIYRMLRALKLI